MTRYLRLLPLVVWILGMVIAAFVAGRGSKWINSDGDAGIDALFWVGFVVFSVFWMTAFIWVVNKTHGKY
jgi:hypothetical protein